MESALGAILAGFIFPALILALHRRSQGRGGSSCGGGETWHLLFPMAELLVQSHLCHPSPIVPPSGEQERKCCLKAKWCFRAAVELCARLCDAPVGGRANSLGGAVGGPGVATGSGTRLILTACKGAQVVQDLWV